VYNTEDKSKFCLISFISWLKGRAHVSGVLALISSYPGRKCIWLVGGGRRGVYTISEVRDGLRSTTVVGRHEDVVAVMLKNIKLCHSYVEMDTFVAAAGLSEVELWQQLDVDRDLWQQLCEDRQGVMTAALLCKRDEVMITNSRLKHGSRLRYWQLCS
jgi:hypothetical protein